MKVAMTCEHGSTVDHICAESPVWCFPEAFDDLRAAVVWAVTWNRDWSEIDGNREQILADRVMQVLAALSPSIVVDGKVVPLHNEVGDFADWIPDVEWLTGDLMALLDAAREVAE